MARAIVAAGFCVLAAGCASATNLPANAPSPVGSASARPANTHSADSEALRLLSLAQLPPGATELSVAPVGLSGPVMGTPATSSFIDHARYWRVPMPFAATVAWLKAHPPKGLTAGGSIPGSLGEAGDVEGFSYAEPDTDAWVQAQFEVGVVPDGDEASVIRADGVALWLDPVPARDTSSGGGMRVSVAAGCPPDDSGTHGVANGGSDLDAALLPRPRPTAALLCMYDGMNGKLFGLVAQKELDAAQAAQLAAVVAKLPLGHLDDVVTSCPMDDEAAAILAFSYPGRADVDLWYKRNGCQTLSNGHITASPYEGIVDAFHKLVPVASAGP